MKFTSGPLICIIDKQEEELDTRKSYTIKQLMSNMQAVDKRAIYF